MKRHFIFMFWLCGVLAVPLLAQDDFSDDDFDFEVEDSVERAWDPAEKLNRYSDSFNRWVFRKVLRTPLITYNEKVPRPFRNGVSNLFSNFSEPLHLVNCVLQGKVEKAEDTISRFCINSTIGLAGWFDVAGDKLDIEAQKEDFGQTLGSWGLPEGPYLVLPLRGPLFLRDLFTVPFDRALTVDQYFFPHNPEWAFAYGSYKTGHSMAREVDRIDALEKDTIDPYTMVKDAFNQYREAQIKD